MLMIIDRYADHYWTWRERTPTFMIAAGERTESTAQASRRLIIVGVDDSAEAEAAAQWAVREAELRKADVLLVHAGPQRRRALLDKVAGTLTVPPSMHLDQLVAIDSPESLLPRLSEQADLTVLGHDRPALAGHMPFGHTSSTCTARTAAPVRRACRPPKCLCEPSACRRVPPRSATARRARSAGRPDYGRYETMRSVRPSSLLQSSTAAGPCDDRPTCSIPTLLIADAAEQSRQSPTRDLSGSGVSDRPRDRGRVDTGAARPALLIGEHDAPDEGTPSP